MIRPFTLITMALAMSSGAYLFAVKHRAQVLDNQLATVADQTRLDAQRIRVLQAQWSLEIDPTRLAALAHQFTALQPMQPAQLTTMTRLASDLPAPGSAPPGFNPVAPMPNLPATQDAPPDTSPLASTSTGTAPALPLPPQAAPAAPLRMAKASAKPVMSEPKFRVAANTPARATQHPPARSHIMADQLAENLPAPRPVRSVYPMGAQVMSVRATANSSSAPSQIAGGSSLAMGSDLAPPQPLAGGANN